VIWSDETRISIFGCDGAFYVWRRPGEERFRGCLLPTMKHPVAFMIWRCLTWNGIGQMQVVNAARYIDEVLVPKLLPSARDMFHDEVRFIFQRDGPPCHVA